MDQSFPGRTACFAVPDPVWGATVMVASTGPDPATILDRLGPRLASPARPRGFLALDDLPRTASGKIDRLALVEEWERHGQRA